MEKNTMSYIVKAQSYENPNVYCSYECADLDSWLDTIVAVAQTRKKGAKYRLMETSEQFVRFDVQYTKVSD